MKRLLASVALIAAAAALSGCYYDPGYSYVRSSGYGGDAYYGQGSSYYVRPAYYDGYYGSGYYGSGYYGCCYAPGVSIGISSGWYGGSGYYRRGWPAYRGGYRGHDRYRHDSHRGHRDSHQRPGRSSGNHRDRSRGGRNHDGGRGHHR